MINAYKNKSGAKKFVACLGKSSLNKNGSEYKTIEKIAGILIKENLGIIHGGYSGGAMQAINEGAEREIKKQNKNNFLNIGVPLEMFEREWQRVPHGVFSKPAKSLSERIDKIIQNSDIIVVLPKGGFGTMLEFLYAFHLNQMQRERNSKTKPIIFYGGEWKSLMIVLFKKLDIKGQSSGKRWCYYVNSLKDFEKVIKKLKNSISFAN